MYLKKLIGETYKNWWNGQAFLFGTPTGSGKTTFFEGEFREFALSSRKRILYLTNREILYLQMKKRQEQRIIEKMICINSFWERDIPKENEDNFSIVTYQQLENALVCRNYHKIQYFASFDIVICDEAHYFIADSTFNTNTVVSFEFVISNYRNKLMLFLTATHRNILGILTNYLNNFGGIGRNSHLQCVQIKPDYSGLEFKWFYEYECIVKEVAKLPEAEKVLIFVSSISEGKMIKKLLKSVVSAADIFFLSSESDKTDAGIGVTQELVENQCFSKKILIATSKIDTGINITDRKVNTIFLLHTDEETMIQMLGRRRRESTENISVYLFARSRAYFVSRCNQIERDLAYINNVCNIQATKPAIFDSFVAYEFFNENRAEILRKFVGVWRNPSAYPRYFINWLSVYRMQQMHYECKSIVCDFDNIGQDAFVIRQGYWLGFDMSAVNITQPRTYVQSISEFVKMHVGRKLNVTEFDEFRKSLMPLLHEADRVMFPKITENAKWQKLNEFFASNQIPFVIVRELKKRNGESGRSYEIKMIEQGLIYE